MEYGLSLGDVICGGRRWRRDCAEYGLGLLKVICGRRRWRDGLAWRVE